MSVTVSPESRDRLARIRERTRRAREDMSHARRVLDVARQQGDEDAQAVANGQLEAARIEEQLASQLEVQILQQMSGVGASYGVETVWDNPETVRTLEQLAHSSMPIGNLTLGPIQSREEHLAMIESGSWGAQRMAATNYTPDIPDTARVGPYYGVVPQLRRPLRLLDLIPSSPMEGKSFDYTQEGGSFDTAQETPEGALKPTGDLTLTDAQVVAKTIATWIKLKRAQLSDVPALGTTVQQRLTYAVLRRVENQIIGGDGTGENLLGILHTSGIASIPFAAGEAQSDLTLDAISAVIVSDAQPNAVVANPLDVAAMLKQKATGSGDRLDSDGAFATPPSTMWGLPLIQSRVMPQGQALVGDWSVGCTLFVREGVNLRLSDADQDDFVRNMVTALAEGRYGLAVWQPASFAIVHLA